MSEWIEWAALPVLLLIAWLIARGGEVRIRKLAELDERIDQVWKDIKLNEDHIKLNEECIRWLHAQIEIQRTEIAVLKLERETTPD